jgi:hypothetical protein
MLQPPQDFSDLPSTSAVRSLPGFRPTASRSAHLGLTPVPDAITAPGEDLVELVRQLQACTPLRQLSNMEARTVFELLLQRGWRVVRIDDRRRPSNG